MTILKNKYLWLGVVMGMIVGYLIGATFFGKPAPSKPADTILDQTATSSAFSLVVGGQIAGDKVLVLDARVARTTWLAVRENNGDLLGRILGAHRVPSGETKDILVELLRPTIPHLMYAVVMYEDDGDGAFDNKSDSIIEENGQPLLYPFVVN